MIACKFQGMLLVGRVCNIQVLVGWFKTSTNKIKKSVRYTYTTSTISPENDLFDPPATRELFFKEVLSRPGPDRFFKNNIQNIENKVVLALLAGKRTLDWAACKGRLVLGADHPGLINLISGKAKNIPQNSISELQKAIYRITGYEKIIFTKTASEAQELALRLVSSWGERERKDKEKGIALVTPCTAWGHERFPLGTMSKKSLPFDNLSALEGELWTNNSAVAFMMNTINWSKDKGFEVPGTRYLTEVRRICDKHNILWVTDESASAFGRTGYPLAFMAESCRPDIVVIADTLGGGIYPTSAVLISDRVFCGKDRSVLKLPDSCLSNHAAAVGLEVIKGYEVEDLAEAARMNGICLKNAIQWALGPEELTCLTGKGLLMAIRVHGGIGSASEICLEMRKRGVFVWPCSDHYISITPPLTTSQEELVAGVIVLASVLDWLLERTARKPIRKQCFVESIYD